MNSSVKPKGCTHLKLRQIDRAVTRHYDAYVAATGLSNMQYSLLSHIVSLGPLRPGELASRMRMDASTLTRNLQPLVNAGWAVLGPGGDARSRSVVATEAGRSKRAEAQMAWKKAQLALNARLGTGQVQALHELIDECLQRLDDTSDNDD